MFDNRPAQLQATQIKCSMICRSIIEKRRSDHTAHAYSDARQSHACVRWCDVLEAVWCACTALSALGKISHLCRCGVKLTCAICTLHLIMA
jgi:hypothetical protein